MLFNTYTVTINVTPVNDAPRAGDLTITAAEDQTYNGPLPAATDPEGQPFTYGLGSQPQNGTATVSANGTFSYTPNPDYDGPDTFTYTVTDGFATSTYTVTVNVQGDNDAPRGSDVTITATEDQAYSGRLPVAVDPEGLTVSYSVGSILPLHGTVSVQSNGDFVYTPFADYNGPDIFTYTASDGVMTSTYTVTVNVTAVNDAPRSNGIAISASEDQVYSGTLPPAIDPEGQPVIYGLGSQALHGVASVDANGNFTYTPNPDYSGTDTFNFTVSDGTATNIYTITVTIGGVNDPPRGSDDAITVTEDQAYQGQLPLAVDPEGDEVAYELGAAPLHGTVTIGVDGDYVYTPFADYFGADSFTYTVSDGTATSTYTVSITVTGVNDAPRANNTEISVIEDEVYTGRLPVAIDPEGQPFTYGPGGLQPQHGTVTIAANSEFVYTPVADYNGLDSFEYTVTDGTATSTYKVEVTIDTANDAPVGSNISITPVEDQVFNGQFPVASDIDGDTVIYGIGAQPVNGTVTGGPGRDFIYTPYPDYSGPDSFTYTVTDGDAMQTYTVTVNVQPVNDAPRGSDAAIVAVEDQPYSGTLPPAIDPEGQPVIYSAGPLAPAHGMVTVSANGDFVYTPAADYSGPDSFSYTVSDGTASQTYVVTIDVTAVNDAPRGADLAISVEEDETARGTLPVAFDPDSANLVYDLGVAALHGRATVDAGGTYTYIPNPDYNGPDSFTYRVTDGTAVSTYTVTINVTPQNDPPVGSDGTATVTEDVPYDGTLPLASDPDGDQLTYALAGQAAHGTVTVLGDGSYRYIPAANYSGPDSFVYSVTDGVNTILQTITITVLPVADAPVGSNFAFTVGEDGAASGTLPVATDPDGQTPITYGLGSAATHGAVTVGPNGAYTYVPDPDYNGTDSFTYTVSDGNLTSTYTVTVNVTASPDAPVGANGAINVIEDVPFDGTLPVATDADGDPLAYALVGQAAHGTVTILANGTYRYVPALDYFGPDSFSYSVTDGLFTRQYTISITVVPVDDAPQGTDATVATQEDVPTSGQLPPATDIDSPNVTYGLAAGPVHGNVIVNSDGSFTYTPDRNYNGTDTFTYTISDGTSISTYTATVYVAAVNDAPEGSDLSISVGPGVTTQGALPVALDPEGSPVTYGQGTAAAHGTVTISADGRYTYTPAAGYSGPDSFTYTVSDGAGSSTYTVTVSVSAPNTAPVGSDLVTATPEDTAVFGALPAATDPDGQPVRYFLGVNAAHGTVTIDPNGFYRYTPDRNYNGTDVFTYVVSDGVTTSSYRVTIEVTPVNDAPLGSGTSISVPQDAVAAGTLPPAIDPEGAAMTYGVGRQPVHGTLVVLADGTYRYQPFPGYSGPDSFVYTVSDGETVSSFTVVITVVSAGSPEPELPIGTIEYEPPAPNFGGDASAVTWTPDPGTASKAFAPANGTVMESLNGIAGDIGENGPVASVVNSIRSLNGVGSLPDEAAVLHAARQISEWIESGRRIDEFTVGFYKGGSNTRLFDGRESLTWFSVDTMIYAGQLYIMPSPGYGDDGSFTVTQADGSPLPGWLRATRQGIVIGHPPAGLPFIDLRISGISPEGEPVADNVRIDLMNGSIMNHESDREALLIPSLFSDELQYQLTMGDDAASDLAHALSQWRE